MTDLDPGGCEGCRETLVSHGYIPFWIKQNEDGTAIVHPSEGPSTTARVSTAAESLATSAEARGG